MPWSLVFYRASLWRNHEVSERRIEAAAAVTKLSMLNPGTTKDTPQSKATLIKKAAIPTVTIDMGSAII